MWDIAVIGNRSMGSSRLRGGSERVGTVMSLVTRCFAVLLVIAGICCPGMIWAAEKVEDSSTFSVRFENDLFTNTDRHYTNGVKLSWTSPDLTSYAENKDLPQWSHGLIRRLPYINEPDQIRNVTFSLGQNMYTPSDISRTDLMEQDRPYAGWTYGGAAFHSKSSNRLDTIEIQLGMVGPASLAEQSQKFIHDTRGLTHPMGWHHQLKNEPGLALIYERSWRSLEYNNESGFGFDMIPHAGVTLGNVYTYGNAGVEARVGYNVPRDFGVSMIRPAGETGAPADSRDSRINGEGTFSIHLFASVNGKAVARDIFLDGNTFTTSHSVDKKHFVADLAGGVCITVKGFKISYAQVLRTEEYHGQASDHQFGSIAFSFTY